MSTPETVAALAQLGKQKEGENMTDEQYPWRDAAKLEKKYITQAKSTREIADEWGTTHSVISNWLDRHGIQKRPSKRDSTGAYQDEETLRELYVERGLSSNQIADDLNVGATTIRRWLRRHEIERRDHNESRILTLLREPAPFEMGSYGYEQWRTKYEGETYRLKVHRLLAVAEYGFDAVSGKVVHHKNGIPWDNRASNIELLDQEEHIRIHKPSEG